MYKTFSLSCLLLISCCNLFAQQLVVNNTPPNNNPFSLVQNVLSGGGVSITNVTASGANNQQIGYFSNGAGALGINSGVLLSTGNALTSGSSNTSTSTSGNIGNSGSADPDLNQLANGQPVFDYYILEFDVFVTGDQLNIDYVFASEEYGEYVCSDQADVFAILISGPGIAGPFSGGADNFAVVPSTSDYAGINSINDGFPGIFGNGNCIGTGASPYYNPNSNSLFEFDGYTDQLTASAIVNCNATYHVKIIVTDISDANFDSGLFIREEGIYSNSNGTFPDGGFNDSLTVEGCRPYALVIYNATGFNGETLNIQIGGTATNGVDYLPIATSYNLGSDSMLVIQISPIVDGIVEPLETVIISFFLINNCGDTTFFNYTVYIRDSSPMVVTGMPADVNLCAGTSVLLNLNVSGGFPGYGISWNGVAINNVSVIPTATTTYYAEVYDEAGCAYFGNFTAFVHPMPIADAGPDLNLCKGYPTSIGAFINGEPGSTYAWTPAGQLNSASVAYPTMNPQFSQTLTVVVTTPFGCTATDNVTITVLPVPIANAGPDQSIVYLQTTATLSGMGTGTPEWSPNFHLSCTPCYTTVVWPPETTTYTFTVTGSNGCQASDDVVVEVIVPTDVFVPSAFSPNNDGNNDELFVHGYTIAWMRFQVYDIWGNLMFETVDINKGWDGRVNGVEASIGLYVYALEVVFINGAGQQKYGGEINLVR